MRWSIMLPLMASAVALGGCATFLEGKADKSGNQEGLRYALPAPFLMVTPKPDGTLDVQTVNLPDPDNTYTLRTKSFVSAYTLDVTLENQMLKSVSMNPKSDAVAAAAIDSIGNIRKAQIEHDAADKTEAAKTDTEAAKAIAEAKLAVDIAQGKVDVLVAEKADQAKVTDAKVALNEANVKLKALTDGSESGSGLDAADAPVENRSGKGAQYAAGPMLFRILPDGKGVKLVAVRGPTVFATATSALGAPGFDPRGTIQVAPDEKGGLKFEVVYNRPLKNVEGAYIVSGANPAKPILGLQPTITVAADPKGAKLTISLVKGTPPGMYGIYFKIVLPDDTRAPAYLTINIPQ